MQRLIRCTDLREQSCDTFNQNTWQLDVFTTKSDCNGIDANPHDPSNSQLVCQVPLNTYNRDGINAIKSNLVVHNVDGMHTVKTACGWIYIVKVYIAMPTSVPCRSDIDRLFLQKGMNIATVG